MEFLLASGNPHKAEELNDLFEAGKVTVKAAPEKLEVVEDGETYAENALLKARAYYDKFKVPVVSDDSGLNVLSLPEELGIYSARFGGEELSYVDKMLLLMGKLDNIPSCDRSAYFSCTLCFYISPEEVFFFEGRVNGEIGKEIKGEHGFGYDPVFFPEKGNGKSLAELPEWKQSNSHRANAAKMAEKFFNS